MLVIALHSLLFRALELRELYGNDYTLWNVTLNSYFGPSANVHLWDLLVWNVSYSQDRMYLSYWDCLIYTVYDSRLWNVTLNSCFGFRVNIRLLGLLIHKKECIWHWDCLIYTVYDFTSWNVTLNSRFDPRVNVHLWDILPWNVSYSQECIWHTLVCPRRKLFETYLG